MAYNTIKLTKYSDIEVEYTSAGTIYPGSLLLLGSGNTVTVHNDNAPANCLPMFALEDELQGRGIDTAYVSGDKVKCWIPGRGDIVYAILVDGSNVAIGAFLESDGQGYLQAYTSGKVVGIALEAKDLSGSSGAETSSDPLGFNKRIKVRIV